MTFITFIYKIDNNPKTYYGKYAFDYISDDHEGLDIEIKSILIDGLNKFKKQTEFTEQINIGIMSFSYAMYVPVYSTTEEISCFDFYCISEHHNLKIYVNGILVE